MRKAYIFTTFYIFAVSMFSQMPNFQWAKSLGSSVANDFSEDICLDKYGNIFLTGFFHGTVDFDPGPGLYNLTSNSGQEDVFVLKLNPQGNLVWARNMGGPSYDHGYSINVDAYGNVYTTGYFMGNSDFDPGLGTFFLNSVAGTPDVFISKLDSLGNFIWAKQIGGTGSDLGNEIGSDSKGNIYVTGHFIGTVDFNPGIGNWNLSTPSNSKDAFILKLDQNGLFIWANKYGGKGSDNGVSLVIDNLSNVLTTGYFSDTVRLNSSSTTGIQISKGVDDMFILKLDSNGNYLWSKQIGGISGDWPFSISVDSKNNVLTTGIFSGTVDFDPGLSSYNLTCTSSSLDMFVCKLNDNGGFIWAKSILNKGANIPNSIFIDRLDNVYTTGFFEDTTDFDPGPSVSNLIAFGGRDAFILILDSTGKYVWANQLGGDTVYNYGSGICVDNIGNIYTTGWYNGICDYDTGPTTYTISSNGFYDFYIHKLTYPLLNINEFAINKLSIYPNPSEGTYLINLKMSSQIVIYDVLGQEIINEQRNSGKQIIDLQNQANGVYTVKIIEGNIQYTSKIIKQ